MVLPREIDGRPHEVAVSQIPLEFLSHYEPEEPFACWVACLPEGTS
jgi:hypothetical protein